MDLEKSNKKWDILLPISKSLSANVHLRYRMMIMLELSKEVY